MAVVAARVLVGTTPVALRRAEPAWHEQSQTVAVAVPADAPGPVYVGGPGVTAADGWPVAPGGTVEVDLGAADALWAVAASGTVTVACLWTGA